MASLTIRQVPDAHRDALRRRAAAHGVSMEEEVRRLIAEAVGKTEPFDRRRAEAALLKARDMLLAGIPEGRVEGAVDELIAERRAAAAKGE